MKRTKYVLLLALLLLVLLALIVLLLTGCKGRYGLSWKVVGGGGATLCIGESYALGGTAGQPAADMLTGDGYTLTGGFWSVTQ